GVLPLISKGAVAAAAAASIAGLSLLAWNALPIGGSESEALPVETSTGPTPAASTPALTFQSAANLWNVPIPVPAGWILAGQQDLVSLSPQTGGQVRFLL